MIALEIARQFDYDLIHAHDWLTYLAGKEAKRMSGKPLMVHMHATEFDRSGENVNTLVFDIEKEGMEAADKVIAVSNLTRST
jgi:glycogen synthase